MSSTSPDVSLVLASDSRQLPVVAAACISAANAIPANSRRHTELVLITSSHERSIFEVLASVNRKNGFTRTRVIRHHEPTLPIAHGGNYLSRGTYLRYALGSIETADAVVYLDTDVLPVADPSDAFTDMVPGTFGAVVDPFNPVVGEGHALPWLPADHPSHGSFYYNAGVLYGLNAPWAAMVRQAIRYSQALGSKLTYNDQDAINLAFTALPVKTLAEEYNEFELERFLEKSDWTRRVVTHRDQTRGVHAVHFIGDRKPWLSDVPATRWVREHRTLTRDTQRTFLREGMPGLVLNASQPPTEEPARTSR